MISFHWIKQRLQENNNLDFVTIYNQSLKIDITLRLSTFVLQSEIGSATICMSIAKSETFQVRYFFSARGVSSFL